jgi:hypothetical protein
MTWINPKGEIDFQESIIYSNPILTSDSAEKRQNRWKERGEEFIIRGEEEWLHS